MTELAQFQSPVSTSVKGGSLRFTSSTATTIAAAATPVLAAGTTTETGTSLGVTVGTNRLTADWTGAGTRATQVSVTARVDVDAPGGPAQIIALHVYKNGAPLTNPLFREITVRPSDPPSEFHMNASVALADTDYLELWVENVTDTDDLIVTEGSTLTINS